jgi:hypothetical protein
MELVSSRRAIGCMPRGGDTTVFHVAEQTSAQKEDSARASMELVSY